MNETETGGMYQEIPQEVLDLEYLREGLGLVFKGAVGIATLPVPVTVRMGRKWATVPAGYRLIALTDLPWGPFVLAWTGEDDVIRMVPIRPLTLAGWFARGKGRIGGVAVSVWAESAVRVVRRSRRCVTVYVDAAAGTIRLGTVQARTIARHRRI